MPSIKSMGLASIAVLATLAMSAIATASASAAKLTLSESGLALGFEHGMEAYGHGFYAETPDGEIDCGGFDEDGFDAYVVTNSKATDELHVYNFVLSGESCESPRGHAFPDLYPQGPLELRANGKATLGPAVLAITFELSDERSSYGTKMLRGTNTATSTRGPLQLEIDQTLKLQRSESPKTCPKQATMHFETSYINGEAGATAEEPIEEQVF